MGSEGKRCLGVNWLYNTYKSDKKAKKKAEKKPKKKKKDGSLEIVTVELSL